MDLIAGLVRAVLELHRELHQELASILRSPHHGEAMLWPMLGGAFLLGMVHALTPGHGKVILFTYFLGRRARPWAGLLAAAQIAAIHIGAAMVLVLGFGGAMSLIGRSAGAAALLQIVSAAAVIAAGCWYFWRALRPSTNGAQAHGGSGVALAAGLLPCPLTMMILSAAFTYGSVPTGLVLVAVMGGGIMVTIGLVGTLAIMFQQGVAAELRRVGDRGGIVLRILETASALIIVFLGVSSLAATAPGF